ncbi:MAG TPA: NAD-binding protein, partial [Opitutaceae bacterium]
TIPDSSMSTAVVLSAKQLNPDIKVLARARYLAQGGALEEAGADAVSYDEAETATALAVVLKAHLKAGGLTKTG